MPRAGGDAVPATSLPIGLSIAVVPPPAQLGSWPYPGPDLFSGLGPGPRPDPDFVAGPGSGSDPVPDADPDPDLYPYL